MLEVGSTVFAGTSFYYDWGTKFRVTKHIVRGMQCFSLANAVDRLARLKLPENVQAAPAPLVMGLISAVLEELAYAGILTSQNLSMIPLRMGISVAIGMTATQDIKIGLIYGIARELIVRFNPEKLSKPLLVTADSCFFTLIEIKPLDPKLRPYKAISSFFFRVIANTAAYETGLGASLTQHALFNISRSNLA